MPSKLVETDWIPLQSAGPGVDISQAVLATAEVISHPVALAYPHGTNGKIVNHTIELRALMVTDQATPVDLTLKAYRAPIITDAVADWDDNRDFEAFYTKNIDFSTVPVAGSELITNGAFTKLASVAATGSITSGNATVSFGAVTDLSSVVAGDVIFVGAPAPGGFGALGQLFYIVSVNDAGDTVDVDPIPSNTAVSLELIVQESDWDKGPGWDTHQEQAEYLVSGIGKKGKLAQAITIVDGDWHLLTYVQAGDVAYELMVRVGDQLIVKSSSVVAAKSAVFKRLNLGADELIFQSDSTASVAVEDVSLKKVTPFWFSDVRRFDEAADKGAGSAIAYGFLPSASMAGTYLSAWTRRYAGAY